MINTRFSIFKTLQKLLKRLFKQGDTNPQGFKNVMYAVILNDMKEWSEYVGDDSVNFDEMIKKFITSTPDFNLIRQHESDERNVNTPQSNYTWKEVYDHILDVVYPLYYIYKGETLPTSIQLFSAVFSSNVETISDHEILCIATEDLTKTIASAINHAGPFEEPFTMDRSIVTYGGKQYALFTLETAFPLNNKIIVKFN